uniref:tyrosyl-DNA phosphodiesterase 2-like n=1 Tax=Styela clava TaxID=7725 RepID=UPI001939E40A|nr:tyrosyl-DNA phosphodiesterase 2-like [Styela clava]
MLQEVIESTYSYFNEALSSNYIGYSPYDLRQGCSHYFTAIFIRKKQIGSTSATVTVYPDSKLGRDLMVVNGDYHGYKMAFITSHLESMPKRMAERKKQLASLYQTMISQPDNQTVIYGGDTNLEDEEFNSVVKDGKFDLTKVADVWNLLGSPDSTKYTWNTELNDNTNEEGRHRLDRIFLRQCGNEAKQFFKPTSMKFVGMERLPSGRFISDHWGLIVQFAQ